MKRIERSPPKTAPQGVSQAVLRLYRILIVAAIALAVILAAGTVYGLAKRENPGGRIQAASEGGENLFTGLGTMRIPTADSEPETLVISVAFPYDKNDRPFSEELASRCSSFKETTAEYLGALSAEELSALDTDTINAELLHRYNAVLKLGKIRELYILEYMRL